MQVTATKIPEGSYEIRVFSDDAIPGVDPIDLVLNLKQVERGVAEVSMAHGTMTNDANILMALKAMELGFKLLRFKALKGNKVTRWAEHTGSDEHFEHYIVDLDACAAKYLTDRAL